MMLLMNQVLWPTERSAAAHYWAMAYKLKTSDLRLLFAFK